MPSSASKKKPSSGKKSEDVLDRAKRAIKAEDYTDLHDVAKILRKQIKKSEDKGELEEMERLIKPLLHAADQLSRRPRFLPDAIAAYNDVAGYFTVSGSVQEQTAVAAIAREAGRLSRRSDRIKARCTAVWHAKDSRLKKRIIREHFNEMDGLRGFDRIKFLSDTANQPGCRAEFQKQTLTRALKEITGLPKSDRPSAYLYLMTHQDAWHDEKLEEKIGNGFVEGMRGRVRKGQARKTDIIKFLDLFGKDHDNPREQTLLRLIGTLANVLPKHQAASNGTPTQAQAAKKEFSSRCRSLPSQREEKAPRIPDKRKVPASAKRTAAQHG